MLSKEEIFLKRFDRYITTILKTELKRYKYKQKLITQREIVFSDLNPYEMQKLLIKDNYASEQFYVIYKTKLFNAVIHNEVLNNALLTLKEKSREIILLKYWGDVINFKTFSKSYKNKNRYKNDEIWWCLKKYIPLLLNVLCLKRYKKKEAK